MEVRVLILALPPHQQLLPQFGQLLFDGKPALAQHPLALRSLQALLVQQRALFRDADLSGVIGRYAKFQGSDFSGANLSETDLSMADLRGNLNNANCTKADFRGANLEGANLTGANLTQANLHEAKMANAQLQNVKMDGAIGPHGKAFGGLEPGKKTGKPKSTEPWWKFW